MLGSKIEAIRTRFCILDVYNPHKHTPLTKFAHTFGQQNKFEMDQNVFFQMKFQKCFIS